MTLGKRVLKLQQYRAETRYREIYHARCRSLPTSNHYMVCRYFLWWGYRHIISINIYILTYLEGKSSLLSKCIAGEVMKMLINELFYLKSGAVIENERWIDDDFSAHISKMQHMIFTPGAIPGQKIEVFNLRSYDSLSEVCIRPLEIVAYKALIVDSSN